MKGKRSKPLIIKSLYDDMKERGEDEDGDGDRRRKKKKDEVTPGVWRCDLSDNNTKLLKDNEIKILSDKEQGILKHKGHGNIKVLCLQHYKQLIKEWIVNQKKCIGSKLFGKHEAKENGNPRISKVKEVTTDLADKTSMNTSHRIIPGEKICPQCTMA